MAVGRQVLTPLVHTLYCNQQKAQRPCTTWLQKTTSQEIAKTSKLLAACPRTQMRKMLGVWAGKAAGDIDWTFAMMAAGSNPLAGH